MARSRACNSMATRGASSLPSGHSRKRESRLTSTHVCENTDPGDGGPKASRRRFRWRSLWWEAYCSSSALGSRGGVWTLKAAGRTHETVT
jgi:hypothetical protein